MASKRIVICSRCGETKPYYSGGLCAPCYNAIRKEKIARGEIVTPQQVRSITAIEYEIKQLKRQRMQYHGPVDGAVRIMRDIADLESDIKKQRTQK